MWQHFIDKVEALIIEDGQSGAEKRLLDLPADLMHEVFGSLDARSLLETANSHPILHKHVVDWPEKRWEIVHLSSDVAIIDYETFARKDAEILLRNAHYEGQNGAESVEYSSTTNICDIRYEVLWSIMELLGETELLRVAKCHPNLLRATKCVRNKWFYKVGCMSDKVIFWPKDWRSVKGRSFLQQSLSPAEAEILLAGATVEWFHYNLRSDITPDCFVSELYFHGGQQGAHRCAGLIEKWTGKLIQLGFPQWDATAYNANPELAQMINNVPYLWQIYLPIEWLIYIPEWSLSDVRISLDKCLNALDEEITETKKRKIIEYIGAAGLKLYEQWKCGERPRFHISFHSKWFAEWATIGRALTRGGFRKKNMGTDGTQLRWSIYYELNDFAFWTQSLPNEL